MGTGHKSDLRIRSTREKKAAIAAAEPRSCTYSNPRLATPVSCLQTGIYTSGDAGKRRTKTSLRSPGRQVKGVYRGLRKTYVCNVQTREGGCTYPRDAQSTTMGGATSHRNGTRNAAGQIPSTECTWSYCTCFLPLGKGLGCLNALSVARPREWSVDFGTRGKAHKLDNPSVPARAPLASCQPQGKLRASATLFRRLGDRGRSPATMRVPR